MEEILDEYPGRDVYMKELLQLYGHPLAHYPASLYVAGASGTGKTAVLLRLLNHLDISYAFIDCIELYTAKLFYETIVNALQGHKLTANNNFENYATCDGPEDFIDALNALSSSKSYVVVLKNFDRLHDVETNILPIMMRLDTLVKALNISCVLIGSQIELNFIGKIGLVPTINIHCEQFGKSDLLKILSKQIENLRKIMIEVISEGESEDVLRSQRLAILSELDDRFYIGYFNIFLDTFFSICRNSKELVYLSNANFPIYCKPVIDGEIRASDLRKLWKNMELPFKMAMNSIYCRVELKNHMKKLGDQTVVSSTKAEVQRLELPHYTKYLLIAAYLASHNDAKIDKRLFVKHHGKQKKRLQNIRSHATVSKSIDSSHQCSEFILIDVYLIVLLGF